MKRNGQYKGAGQKLVVVDFTEADGLITNVSISGDFFLEPEETLQAMNDAIEGMPANETIATYARAISAALPAHAVLLGVTPDGVGVALRRAVTDAARWRELEWQIVVTPTVSPAVNVALDEVMLREVAAGRRGPTLRIWEWDSDAVIIGSFQSVANEIDEPQANELKTTPIRRISGGGAMYMQPEASITYSVYVPTAFVEGMSFTESYSFLDEWVLEALHSLGVEASYEPLNDITSPQGKIGGAAQKRLAAGAVLHHVTMAYDMDAERMIRVLRIGREKMSDKGTKSASKRVDPLRSQTGLPRHEIIEHLQTVFAQRHGATVGEVSADELAQAEELADTKFLTEEWLRRVP